VDELPYWETIPKEGKTNIILIKYLRMNEWDSAVTGIRGNVYNWLVYGTVNGVIHNGIASYAYFHNAILGTCHCPNLHI